MKSYSMKLRKHLATSFLESFVDTLKDMGFEKKAEVISPEAPNVMEYKSGNILLQFTVDTSDIELTEIYIDSINGVDISPILEKAIKNFLTSILESLLSGELANRYRAIIDALKDS